MTGYVVTGPGVQKTVPALGAALGYAQRVAEQADSPVTVYVREGDEPCFHVERDPDGIVTTRKVA